MCVQVKRDEATSDEAVRPVGTAAAAQPISVEVLRLPPRPSGLPLRPGGLRPAGGGGSGVVMEDSVSDCCSPPPVTMATTATQTDDCSLEDVDDDVDLDHCGPSPPARSYAFYDRL